MTTILCNFLVMHVAVKCCFFKFSIENLITIKLEDNQLCTDCLPCVSFSFDISVGLQAVVKTTVGVFAPNYSPSFCGDPTCFLLA